MAGERKGVIYEALLYFSLEKLKERGVFEGDIFWNEIPDGMTIEPDFLIGNTKDTPTILFLVTHSGSAAESHKKLWRNIGELVEAKVLVKTEPLVYNIVFDSVVKQSLKEVQEAAFDGQLVVGDKKYGPALRAWVDKNAKSFPANRNRKVEYIRKILGTSSKKYGISSAIEKLEDDVKSVLRSKNPLTESVWTAEKKRKKSTAPRARNTFLRRGLAKLSVFEDVGLLLDMWSGNRVAQAEIPHYAFLLGIVRRTIGGAVLADEEARNSLNVLEAGFGNDAVSGILQSIIAQASDGYRAQLLKIRNLERLDAYQSYIERHYQTLVTTTGMLRALEELYANPIDGLELSPGIAPPEGVWMFDYISSVVKAREGKAQAFGYSAFSKHPAAASSTVGNMDVGVWSSCFMNQYFTGKSGFTAPENAVRHCALVLAEALQQTAKEQIPELSGRIKDAYVAKEFEATLLSHNGFDPILSLVRRVSPSLEVVRIRSCFSEAAGLTGQSGKTQVGRVSNTIINWQSCHGSHTNDKKKELCGRAVGLRYIWDSGKKKYLVRPGVKKLILVVDGTWKQNDLDALARAGWDQIFYPDEIDKLKNAIV